MKNPFARFARIALRPGVMAALLATSAGVGCSTYSTHVGSDDGSLGKVVVYRNGIAYFERKADASGAEITLRVPQDKVDDFLKSLTVKDAATGKTYPVSFPTQAAASDGNVDMVVQLPPEAKGEVVLSYITDSPSWKPSYRLVVEDSGAVTVQGWAIVDNTSGEDWKSVHLGVGSSSALSFRYDLRSIRLVHRETLHDQQQFAMAPPGGDAVTPTTSTAEPVLAALTDDELPKPADHPDVAKAEEQSFDYRSGPAADGAAVTGGAMPQRPSVQQARGREGNRAQIQTMATALKDSKKKVIINGYAEAGERDASAKSLDRANLLRNQLIEEGVAPAQLEVAGNGAVAGRRAGVVLMANDKETGTAGDGSADSGGRPIGESHFESGSTMTVARGTSAMVAILDDKAKGDVVYLYDADSPRGNSKFAFKAVRFTNPTKSTLESGPVTVYGEGRFIGEGLSEPIPPGTTAFVPFALDRQVIVDKSGSTGDRISRLVTLQRGVLTAEMQHTKKSIYKVTNRAQFSGSVFIKHAVPEGWVITSGPESREKLGDSQVFHIDLAAGETKTVTVEEATPITRTVDVRSNNGVELVRAYLEAGSPDPRFAAAMKGLLTLHTDIANTEQSIDSTREQMGDYRARIDELEGQLAHLKSLKTDGKLLKHLSDKMVDVSNRLQKATIAVVELQQTLLMQRVQFQDGVSELTLERAVSQAK